MKQQITLLMIAFSILSLGAQTSFPSMGELFRDDVVPRIDIFVDANDLALILHPDNARSNEHYPATFIFNNGIVLDTITQVGFRLRGNTSRHSGKKSFKISFNTYEAGGKYYGVEKLNLNGEHNDPSILRSKIAWDLAREMGVVAPRCNPVALYINEEYRGLYLNVEHIDEEFAESRYGNKNGNLYKCLYPADLDYKGSNPDVYKEEYWGNRAYQLKTNEAADNYSDLANFIDVLNNMPDSALPCALEQVFNVQDYLKAIAFDVLIGNWDGPIYNKNNFYLYHNQAADKFEYIPYDVDNTFGIDWFRIDWAARDIYNWSQIGEARPLYSRLLDIPEYHALYSYYMNQFVQEIFTEAKLFPYLDHFKNTLREYAEDDTYRNLDYGFTMEDWEQSFSQSLNYNHTPYGLKDYISKRRSETLNQLEVTNIAPIINQLNTNMPTANEAIHFQAIIADDSSVESVQLCYQINGQGAPNCIAMTTQDAQDFTATIEGLDSGTALTYRIVATDDSGAESSFPRCGSYSLVVLNADLSLAVNEFMASNDFTIADNEGEYDDWLEIYNYGTEAIYLGDKYLSDDEDEPNKWAFPDISIQPDEYLLFWADNDEEQGDNHTNFKLSAGGEFIGIFDSEAEGFALIDGIQFGEQTTDVAFGRLPNGTGIFQPLPATPAAPNMLNTATLEYEEGLLQLQAFPNPFHEVLHIQLETDLNLPFQIQVQDAFGRTLFETTQGKTWQIDTHQLASGLYFISLHQNGKLLLTEKLILQR